MTSTITAPPFSPVGEELREGRIAFADFCTVAVQLALLLLLLRQFEIESKAFVHSPALRLPALRSMHGCRCGGDCRSSRHSAWHRSRW